MFSVSLIMVLFSYVLIVFLLATVSHGILEICESLSIGSLLVICAHKQRHWCNAFMLLFRTEFNNQEIM